MRPVACLWHGGNDLILIFSDLHFADTTQRRTVDSESLCDLIEQEAAAALKRGTDNLTVLLLGDIFEVLKSQLWIDRNARPWDPVSPSHADVVTAIFERIESSNAKFFNGVASLKNRFPKLSFVYVPGNHDWPLNAEVGLAARGRLVELLKIDNHAVGSPFGLTYARSDHGLLASHGHEHDLANRTEPGRIALGDAVVIEVLLRLPELVAAELGWSPADSRLEYLHELDNVRPQSPAAMAAWLLGATRRLAVDVPAARALRWARRSP